MKGVGMKEQEMGEVAWMAGLPLGVWLLIGAAFLAMAFVLLVMALASMSQEQDYRVRGWENRPSAPDDEWWKREYPEVHDER